MHRVANLCCLFLLLWTACTAGDAVDVDRVGDTGGSHEAALTKVGASPQADAVHYTCGYALAGHGCDSGRGHTEVFVANMTAAIAACHAAQPASLPDFCYVIDAQGGTAADATQCAAAAGSWRPANACCNFFGTVSCPAQYRCGYALAGFHCDNGRGHVDVFAASMTAAIAACHASQPPSLPDFCYVSHAEGVMPTDPSQCTAAGGSWRSNSSCCNFQGSLSCP